MQRQVHQGATLEYLTLFPDGYAEGTPYPLLIWLHGFGADMHDLADLAAAVRPSGSIHILPNAPYGGCDGPEGTVRAWFERGGQESQEAVQLALAALDTLVQEVLARFRVPTGQALLLGFSQGGNLALRYGLPRPDVFPGLAALSCSLRQANALCQTLPVQRTQSIFLAHGVHDLLVPVAWGRQVAAFLTEQGYLPIYQEYPLGHEISPALVTSLTRWIATTLPPRVPG